MESKTAVNYIEKSKLDIAEIDNDMNKMMEKLATYGLVKNADSRSNNISSVTEIYGINRDIINRLNNVMCFCVSISNSLKEEAVKLAN
jgi:hypothetical protein